MISAHWASLTAPHTHTHTHRKTCAEIKRGPWVGLCSAGGCDLFSEPLGLQDSAFHSQRLSGVSRPVSLNAAPAWLPMRAEDYRSGIEEKVCADRNLTELNLTGRAQAPAGGSVRRV